MASEKLQSYLEAKRKERGGGGIRRHFTRIGMSGKTGEFTYKRPKDDGSYDEAKPLGADSFTGVIVRVAYFSQSRYNPNAAKSYRTREFAQWRGEEVVLAERSLKDGKWSWQDVRTFADYGAFKDAVVPTDPITGEKMKSPYELTAALYVLTPKGETVRYEIGGSGLGGKYDESFFNFKNLFHKHPSAPEALVQCLVRFGRKQERNEATDSVFFRQTCEVEGIADDALAEKAIDEEASLAEWAESWKSAAKKTPPADVAGEKAIAAEASMRAGETDSATALADQFGTQEPDLSGIPF